MTLCCRHHQLWLCSVTRRTWNHINPSDFFNKSRNISRQIQTSATSLSVSRSTAAIAFSMWFLLPISELVVVVVARVVVVVVV